MEISIKQGEGVSQAIKRQLMNEGIQANQFKGSIWSKIQQSLQDGASVIQHGEKETKIGELWTSLSQNVKTYINDVLKIVDSTWNNIKSLFTSAPTSTGTQHTGEIPPAPELDSLPPKPDTSGVEAYSESDRLKDTYRTYDDSKTEYPYNENSGLTDAKYYDYDGKLVFWEESTENGIKTHYYDTNGKEVKCVEEDDEGHIISITEYDKNGEVLQVTTFENGYHSEPKSNIEFSYDSQGNLCYIIEYENGEKKRKTAYKNGEIKWHQEYEHNASDGSYDIVGHSDSTGSEYIEEQDADGNRVRQIYYRADGSTVVINRQPDGNYVRYDYDSEGNLTEQYWCDEWGTRV